MGELINGALKNATTARGVVSEPGPRRSFESSSHIVRSLFAADGFWDRQEMEE